MTAQAFDGQLNSNEIYEALFNVRILFQKLAPQIVKRDEIVSLLEKAVGMYGDTGIVQGMDIQGTYDFGMDAEASKLLAVNRNKSQKIEKYTINKWRQTDVTNDAYISKRAFLDEGAFALFNAYVVGTLSQAMDAFESGMVKSSVGTYVSPVAACNITVELPVADGTEATERIRAAKIKQAILDLKADMADNQRKYNGYGFYASYNWDDFTPVFNTKYLNEINALALYKAFNPEYIKLASEGRNWTPKWFGNVLSGAHTVQDGEENMYFSTVECNSDGSNNFPLTATQVSNGVYRIFPGDPLPVGFVIGADDAANAYLKDEKVIAKVFAPEYVYYMTGYEQGESFYNPRSATTNHYLRKGFSPVMVSKFRPFITIKEVNPATKYNLTVSADDHCSVSVTKNGVAVTPGTNAITAGDVLTITATPNAGYKMKTLTVGGESFTSGNTVTVSGNLTIAATSEALATYNLSVTADEHCTVAVTKGGVAVTPGSNAITEGDVLTITATAAEGYQIASLTVGGEAFVSGNTVTVSGNVTVVASSEAA